LEVVVVAAFDEGRVVVAARGWAGVEAAVGDVVTAWRSVPFNLLKWLKRKIDS
jgi:hypothetical protein